MLKRVCTVAALAAVFACAGTGGSSSSSASSSTSSSSGSSSSSSGGSSSSSGGSSSSSGGSSSSSGGSSSSSTSSSSSGGPANIDCAHAAALEAGQPSADALQDATSSKLYFSAQVGAGDTLFVFTRNGNAAGEYDPSYVDTVVTIRDSMGNILAVNDDAFPRVDTNATVRTVVPAAGTVCIEVGDCNAVLGTNCAPASGVVDLDFTVAYTVLTAATATLEMEANGDAATANTVARSATTTPGTYYLQDIVGQLATEADVDVFKFTIPADQTVAAGAVPTATFYVQAGGAAGTGSTLPGLTLAVALESAPAVVLARIHTGAAANGQLSIQATAGTSYLLTVTSAAGAPGARPFYIVTHATSGSNPMELEMAGMSTNDTAATAEALTINNRSYFVSGNLTAGTDVDVFSTAVPAPVAPATDVKVSISCSSAAYGSGLVGFKVDVLTVDGIPLAGMSTATEGAEGLLITDLPIPAGTTSTRVKLSAASLSADVTSTAYLCGIHFN